MLLEVLMEDAPTEETMWDIVKAVCAAIMAAVAVCLAVYIIKSGRIPV